MAGSLYCLSPTRAEQGRDPAEFIHRSAHKSLLSASTCPVAAPPRAGGRKAVPRVAQDAPRVEPPRGRRDSPSAPADPAASFAAQRGASPLPHRPSRSANAPAPYASSHLCAARSRCTASDNTTAARIDHRSIATTEYNCHSK